MPRLRLGRPLWLDRRASRPPRFSRYRGNLSVDVVIIGGGVTGAIAAYAFADAGLAVALLEARRIGRGSTAASTALLMQEPDEDFRELVRRYGRRAARRMWQAIGSATTDLVSLIKRLRISCELRQGSSIYYTDTDEVGDLRKEFEARRAAGLKGRWLSARAVKRRTGIAAGGAILTPGNAQLDPYKACVGLVQQALARGARIFEYSAGAARQGPSRRCRRDDEGRDPSREVRSRRHWLRDTGVQPAGRPLPDDEYLCDRDATAVQESPAASGSARPHAVGHGSALPLSPLDERPPPSLWRRGYAAQTIPVAQESAPQQYSRTAAGPFQALSDPRRPRSRLCLGGAVRPDTG